MRGAIFPLPQYVFMPWCLLKHRDSFTFFTLEMLFKVPFDFFVAPFMFYLGYLCIQRRGLYDESMMRVRQSVLVSAHP
jgi:hypothetical protein